MSIHMFCLPVAKQEGAAAVFGCIGGADTDGKYLKAPQKFGMPCACVRSCDRAILHACGCACDRASMGRCMWMCVYRYLYGSAWT